MAKTEIAELQAQRAKLEQQIKAVREKERALERKEKALTIVDDRVLVKKDDNLYSVEITYASSCYTEHKIFWTAIIENDIKTVKRQILVLIEQLTKTLMQLDEISDEKMRK